MAGYILFGILILILLLAAVLLIRTCMQKPTPAKTAKVELQDNDRAKEYGERLARMVRKETVSSRARQAESSGSSR